METATRTRRKILISTQVVTKLVQQMMEKAGDGDQEGLLVALRVDINQYRHASEQASRR